MKKAIYNAALIGCGKIGSEFAEDLRLKGTFTHADAYEACKNTQLVAVCDVDQMKLEKCGKLRGITALYNDAGKMMAEQKPDIVSICAPDANHYEMIQLVLKSPDVRAVLVEKPLALSMREAQDVVRLSHRRNIVLTVNYMRRYAPGLIELKSAIHRGKIGSVQAVTGLYSKGTLHNGTHWFDMARFLVGEVVQVIGVDSRRERGEDPTLDASLRFESGASGCLLGCDSKAYAIFEMDIVGTEGRIRITDSGHRLEWQAVGQHPRYNGLRSLLPDKEITDGGIKDVLLLVVKDIVACLETGRKPCCSGDDAVAALRIALAIVESAKSGSTVTLV